MFKRVIEEDYLTRLPEEQRKSILSFSEMTDCPRCILCGLLREHVPGKRLEIGKYSNIST